MPQPDTSSSIPVPTTRQRLDRAVSRLIHPDAPLSPGELQALQLRGVIREQVGGSFIKTEHPDSVLQRAVAAYCFGANLFTGRWAVSHSTAAWIHLSGPAPADFQAVSGHPRRMSRSKTRGIQVTMRKIEYMQAVETSLHHGLILSLGPILFTSVEQTIIDLLRFFPGNHQLRTVSELLPHCDEARLARTLASQRHLAGMETAIARYRQLVQPAA
ncbi:hypothetical protein QDX23_03710 [Auritidibacter ignavus]|uniref:hypothetical protein n=1 Tax=Auritidibacter ignavus TaxID=678932 RepID=UPI00244CCA01|nr:hypothetical protein [Auritidibacter ignavus]WGH86855.1 hypothetical protein QDX24_03350 [Auritidibacter ignavus]WGH89139.1 hypothetical protein QDX22_03345 [Auritidibacter ignavus]WGH91483.1 hypothetical protein QDX23_03710 [Auritidibacter ignavus]WHS34715.1 hypothetical protein QM403_10445 [Auritidibacter ignavus]